MAQESGRGKPEVPGGQRKELGDFVLLERIGSGGMGVVFKATQKSLNRLVAVKILSPKVAKDHEFLERFAREARAAAALSHPNIVRAIAVGEAHGLHYFAMELLEGETARQRLDRVGPLPFADLLAVGRQTALALAHAHRKGVLHRDIKPENLMLQEGRDGLVVKVMDFGLARLERQDSSLTQDGMALGTPLYISPEVARAVKNLTAASDLYSLGATLFHLATGRPPFLGDTAVQIMTQHVTDPPPDPKELNPALPDEFCALLLQLLAKKPEDRYESADVLAEDFRAAMDGDASASEPDDAGEARGKARPIFRRRAFSRRDRPARSSSLAWVLVLLFFAGGGGSAYYYLVVAKQAAVTPADDGKKGMSSSAAAAEQERLHGDELLAIALKVEKERPDDIQAQLRTWTELRNTGAAWRHAEMADRRLDELGAKLAAAGAKTVSDTLAKARDLANKADYNAALAALDAVAQQYRQGVGKESIEAAAARIRARAQADGEKLLKRIADAETAGDKQALLDACAAALAYKYEPVSGKAAEKLAALQGKPKPEAEQPKTEAEQPKVTPLPEKKAAPPEPKEEPPALDEKELAAIKAWDTADFLFTKKLYPAAQKAFLAFKTDYSGTKTLAEKQAKLTGRLEALDILVGK